MVATWTEGLDVIISLFKDDWNRGNTRNYRPIVLDVADVSPERGKRLDLQKSDYILCYETAHNEEAPELFYDFVTTRINITVDMRTIKSRSHLQSLENEVRRLIHTKRKGDGTNFDRLVFKTRTDLSDRSKKLFRMTFQIEVVILAEQIP
jgi:hypothetical protein|tara:strand:+ start:1864 stop:2313 length:450 start_codon:yes stop_codon:yes gene_type:complete